MRLFIAIELPEQVIDHLDLLCRQIYRMDVDLDDADRWVRRANAHLTLEFLGEVEDGRVEELKELLSGIVVEPLQLAVTGMLYFPRRGPVHVIAVRVEDMLGSLAILHDRIEQACETFGAERESRAYQPHITLARWRLGPRSYRLAWHRKETFEAAFPGPIAILRQMAGFLI